MAEFKEKGLYKTKRSFGDKLTNIPYKAFYADPAANPLATSTGKFEIYCPTLSGYVNSVGFSTISPIAKWQIGDPEQGQGTQTEEYPLLLWTPHSLRRAHTVNDNVASLREAFPQECFMSEVDAQERGIKNGDIVLMTSPHGKVLRPAKVMPTLVPGSGGASGWRMDPDRRGDGYRFGRRSQHPAGAEVFRRSIPVLDWHPRAGGEVYGQHQVGT